MFNWDAVVVKEFPQQDSTSVDCGIYMLKAIESVALGNSITFKNDDIKRIRVEIASQLLRRSTIEEYAFRFLTLPKCEEGGPILID